MFEPRAPLDHLGPFAISPRVWSLVEGDRLYLYDAQRQRQLEGNLDMARVLACFRDAAHFSEALAALEGSSDPDHSVRRRGPQFADAVLRLLQQGILLPQATTWPLRDEVRHDPKGTRRTSFRSFLDRISLTTRLAGSKPLERPLLAEWEVTNACNLRCFYCYFGAGDRTTTRELSTDEALAVADDLADAGVLSVTLEGGEPLLREDLPQIIARLKGHRLQVCLLTNGTLLTRSVAERLAGLLDPQIDYVQISLDGARPATHEMSRGPGSFAATHEGLRNASRGGIPLVVSMVLHQGNIDDLLPTYLSIRRYRSVRSFFASDFMKAGRALKLGPVDKRTLLGHYARFQAATARMGPPLASLLWGHLLHLDEYYAPIRRSWDGLELHYCRAARAKVTVAADGELYPCHFLMYPPFRLGDLTRERLRDIWRSSLLDGIREPRDRLHGECFRCDRGRYCGKKCMGLAYASSGDLNQADPNCLYVQRRRDEEAAPGPPGEGQP